MRIPPPRLARFDEALGAWIFSRYADVLAALREPRLSAVAARGEGTLDEAAHLRFRGEAAAALSPESLQAWRADLDIAARDMLSRLPVDRPVDLVSEFAEPWSLRAAMAFTGRPTLLSEDPQASEAGPLEGPCVGRPYRAVSKDSQACGAGASACQPFPSHLPSADPDRLASLARDIFAAAADPYNAALQPRAEQATRELAGAFRSALAAFHIQAFVALSQTLPCFLANAWLALLRHPAEMRALRAEPPLMPNAIEELLRYAGPSRAQFRRATAGFELGGASLAAGDRAILMLASANRDPEQFAEPDRLDLRRPSPRHLAFGSGAHACIGAPLIRKAAAVATTALPRGFDGAEAIGPIEWRGGFAIACPARLRVLLAQDGEAGGPATRPAGDVF